MHHPVECQPVHTRLPFWSSYEYSSGHTNTHAIDSWQIPPETQLHPLPTPSVSPYPINCSACPGPARPFKVLSKLPPPGYHDVHSYFAYQAFRGRMLSQVDKCKEVNKKMRRTLVGSSKSNDPTYLEKRKKNNDAARKSRIARKVKEDEIAIRCAFLEQENKELRIRLAALESETKLLQGLFVVKRN